MTLVGYQHLKYNTLLGVDAIVAGSIIATESDGTVTAYTVAGFLAAYPDVIIQDNWPQNQVEGHVVLGNNWVSSATVNDVFESIQPLSFPVQPDYAYSYRFVISFGNTVDLNVRPMFSIDGPTADSVNNYTLITGVTNLDVGDGADVRTTEPLGHMALSHAQGAYDGFSGSPNSAIRWTAQSDGNFAVVEGFVIPTDAGTIVARVAFSSPSGRIITVQKGSYVDYKGVPVA